MVYQGRDMAIKETDQCLEFHPSLCCPFILDKTIEKGISFYLKKSYWKK